MKVFIELDVEGYTEEGLQSAILETVAYDVFSLAPNEFGHEIESADSYKIKSVTITVGQHTIPTETILAVAHKKYNCD